MLRLQGWLAKIGKTLTHKESPMPKELTEEGQFIMSQDWRRRMRMIELTLGEMAEQFDDPEELADNVWNVVDSMMIKIKRERQTHPDYIQEREYWDGS